MVLFDPHRYAYPSRRSVVYARRAMACTSVPLGAQVGLDVMKAGGMPWMRRWPWPPPCPCWSPQETASGGLLRPGLGGAGEKAVRPERQRRVPCSSVRRPGAGAGLREMPKEGWLPTMVPGAPGDGQSSTGASGPAP